MKKPLPSLPTANSSTSIFSFSSSSSSSLSKKSNDKSSPKPQNSKSAKQPFLKFWKKDFKKDPKPVPKTSNLFNVTINVNNSSDVFGIGILCTMILTLLDKHSKFLSRQSNFISYVIICWEMIMISLCVLYLGRML